MFPSDLLMRQPRTVALLAPLALSYLAAGHALPRQTSTVELREIDAVPWPIATAAAVLPGELQQRQLNTVCGYIGGDPDLPATCSADSHCAVDLEHGAIGCCPDGGPCTQGIFTGCVDVNSDPQTEINPYVFTCSGSNVCYKNAFDGGFFQFGCGSTSALGTTVDLTASDKPSLDLESVSAHFTKVPSTLSEPTTIGSRTKKASSHKTTKSSTTTSAKTSTKSSTQSSKSSKTTTADTTGTDMSASDASATSSNTAAASAPKTTGTDSGHTGAIVGGTVGGVAALVALVSLGIFFWRRKAGNSRKGPGTDQETRYISSPVADGRHNFAPLPTMREVDEAELPQNVPPARPLGGEFESDLNEAGPVPYHPTYPYGYGPGSTAGGVAAVGGGDPHIDTDQIPLTREIDDFSRNFNTALDDIQDDDTPHSNGHNMAAYPGPRGGDGGRPLWQQNRRRSRNLMWM